MKSCLSVAVAILLLYHNVDDVVGAQTTTQVDLVQQHSKVFCDAVLSELKTPNVPDDASVCDSSPIQYALMAETSEKRILDFVNMCKDLGILKNCRKLLEAFNKDRYTMDDIAAVCKGTYSICTNFIIRSFPLDIWNTFKGDETFALEECEKYSRSTRADMDDITWRYTVYMKYFHWKKEKGVEGFCQCRDVILLAEVFEAYKASRQGVPKDEIDSGLNLMFNEVCNGVARTHVDRSALSSASYDVLLHVQYGNLEKYSLDFLIKYCKSKDLIEICIDNHRLANGFHLLYNLMYPPGRPYQEDKPAMTFKEAEECAKVFAQVHLSPPESETLMEVFGKLSLKDGKQNGAFILEVANLLLLQKENGTIKNEVFHAIGHTNFITNIIDVMTQLYPVYKN